MALIGSNAHSKLMDELEDPDVPAYWDLLRQFRPSPTNLAINQEKTC